MSMTDAIVTMWAKLIEEFCKELGSTNVVMSL